MNDNNSDKIKKVLQSKKVPEELSPDNIKKMLDEKALMKKRQNIKKTAIRMTAGAAACAVICGVGMHYAGQGNLFNKESGSVTKNSTRSTSQSQGTTSDAEGASFMNSASDYSDLYYMLEKASESYRSDKTYVAGVFDDCDMSIAENASENEAMFTNSDSIAGAEHSETYNQEEGVAEADIVKTDGEYIYYLYNDYYSGDNLIPLLNIAQTDNGIFTDSASINLLESFDYETSEDTVVTVCDMYLYNDMIIVLGTINDWYEDYDGEVEYWKNEDRTFVNVYTTGISPQLTYSYLQDGYYNDVRITADGYMYLITNDASESYDSIQDAEDVSAYIPSYVQNGTSCLIAPEDILLPGEEFSMCYSISYTIIGGLDLNVSGYAEEIDVKAIAGFSGNIYCSGSSLYTASGWDNTEITRFSLSEGMITPEASGSVKGYINDQFSMSEYNGYFRIATTYQNWGESIFDDVVSYFMEDINNYVYVLDMELNEVGKISDFGIDETIKSVNFSGDMAYVVTYEQTDPLFSIDLSDPTQPVILDEFKILGYSTYMQQWIDGALLGFGVYADENGIEDGVKLVMFDNSDPNNLDEIGIYQITSDDMDYDGWVSSSAVWERKALLVVPEKNLIGVPVQFSGYSDEEWISDSKYMFFSYESGEFRLIGELSSGNMESYNSCIFARAVYIGDYVYALSGKQFISADIASITVTDKVEF